MIKTIIFDVGGVLITPSEKVTPFIISEICNIPLEIAMSEYTNSHFDLKIGKLKVAEFVDRIWQRYKTGVMPLDLACEYLKYYEKQAVINEEVMELIEKVGKNHKIVAFSNMIDLHFECNMKRKLFRFFHKIYLSSQIGVAKPEKKAFEFVLKDLNVKPGECLFIDDNPENVAIAAGLGISAYHFETAPALEGFLQKQVIL
jgi:HAD superfamily hydrolase (TIGR01509 family)